MTTIDIMRIVDTMRVVHSHLCEIAGQSNKIESYHRDLLVHDLNALLYHKPRRFVWGVRRTGTTFAHDMLILRASEKAEPGNHTWYAVQVQPTLHPMVEITQVSFDVAVDFLKQKVNT